MNEPVKDLSIPFPFPKAADSALNHVRDIMQSLFLSLCIFHISLQIIFESLEYNNHV